MRTFTTKGGQIFEVWESRKEALHDVADIIDGIRYAIEIGQRTDDLLWVQYKDGSHYCISSGDVPYCTFVPSFDEQTFRYDCD